MQYNWIDIIILIVILYHSLEGGERGFISIFSNTVAFFVSLWIAVRFHKDVGAMFVSIFHFPAAWTNVVGYLVLAFPSEVMINSFLVHPLHRIPKHIIGSAVNKWLGSLFAVANGLLFFSFLLLVILALPIRGSIKHDIKNSRIASMIVLLSERFGGNVQSSLDSITREALKFITIKPQSKEQLTLDVFPDASQLTGDPISESQMIDLVNQEREKQGLAVLYIDENLTGIARGHSRDMFQRRYFSHFSPEGHDVSFRAKEAGLSYSLIGENLAYAQDVTMAHTGLMNSEGHRKNILDPAWIRIGIGVIDGDVYGKIFTQVFAN